MTVGLSCSGCSLSLAQTKETRLNPAGSGVGVDSVGVRPSVCLLPFWENAVMMILLKILQQKASLAVVVALGFASQAAVIDAGVYWPQASSQQTLQT